MILSILQHTPAWVFAVFAGLVWLGIQRTKTCELPVSRLLILPVVMSAFSLFGLVSAFGFGTATLATWAGVVALVLAAAWTIPARHAVQYSAATQVIRVPGSWLPLVLMMTIFFLRYAVAVLLAMNPDLRTSLPFAVSVSALYGLSSAAFAARTLRIWRSRDTTSMLHGAVAA